MWAWGNNGSLELSDTTLGDTPFPVQVKGLSGIIAISAGAHHSLALKSDGTLWGWGNNQFLQMGTLNKKVQLPLQIQGLNNITSIECGPYNSFVIANDTVYGWGFNQYGNLGNGTTTNTSIPTAVNISNVKSVSPGFGFTVVFKKDGTIWSWGDKYNGQLGNGTTTSTLIPAQVAGLDSIAWIKSSISNNSVSAIKHDGTFDKS